MKNTRTIIAITGTLAVVMALSTFAAFAATKNNAGNMPKARGEFSQMENGKGGPCQKMDLETLKAKLAEKVTAGEITQEQADKMIADFQAREAKMAEEKAKFDAMTDAEKAQYLADRKANRPDENGMRGPCQKMDLETLKAKLAEKVTVGEITQEQADKMIAEFQARETKMAEEKAKFDAMTDAEKAQYLADRKANRPDENGMRGPRQKMDLETLKAKLAEKVTAGEITQEQADQMIADCQARETKMAEEKAKFDAMTDAEKAQYMADRKANRPAMGNGHRGMNRGAEPTATPTPSV